MSSSSPIPWSSIPHKGQLAIICSVRIVDMYQQASLQAYMYYQLASFDPTADESKLSFQVGILSGIFTAAQVFTGIPFGRLADHPAGGRKRVILISLVGQGISCLGLGFSSTFTAAVIWRLLGSAVNASVGGARTALAEATDKKYHPQTFLLLPLAWNIATIIGPPLGGLMSDPVKYYPGLFGENSTFGGKNGVGWMRRYPYAAANGFNALLLFLDAALVFFALRETLPSRRDKPDLGISLAKNLRRQFDKATFHRSGYTRVLSEEQLQPGHPLYPDEDFEMTDPATPLPPPVPTASTTKPPPRLTDALTLNVLLVLLLIAFFDFHQGGFTSLWTILLSTPTSTTPPHLPFTFTGGLAFPPSTVGLAMSFLGIAGLLAQLTAYPRLNARHGLIRCTTAALSVFPLAYAIAPYLVLLSGHSVPLWIGIVAVAGLVIGARTFVIPGIVLLNNNSCPRPELLGTVHGFGATVSSAVRTVGPVAVGWSYGVGVARGRIGDAWWLMSLVSLAGCIPIFYVRDGI